MSKRIFISLGSLVVLAGTACALSFLDLNFAKAIEEEEEYREFSLNTEEQPNPNIPKEPLEEETHLQEIQNDDSEVTEPQIEIPSQPIEEESPVISSQEPEEEPLPAKATDPEQDATSLNSTVTQEDPSTEPTTTLKNQQVEEPPKTPEIQEEPKKPLPPPETKTPQVPPKPQKPEKTETNQINPPTKGKSTSSTSGKEKTIKEIWGEGKQNNKNAEPAQGIKTTNLIRDYSFRLVNSCTSGTIWILDYELPTGTEYPTKFFFGTSAQVAAKISFNTDNIYQQVLPKDSNNCDNTRIFGETDVNYGGADHYRKHMWNTNEHGVLEDTTENNNVEKWLNESHKPPYFYYDVKDIRLAYVATDFLGTSNNNKKTQKKQSDSHIADFAVIEIDFQNKEIAERMTRDFHRRYKDKDAINFFAKPLLETKSNQNLYDESMDIYVAGYSKNGLKGRSSGSFNLDSRQASKLTYSSSHKMINYNSEGDILGHADASHSTEPIKGYDTDRYPRGLEIVISHDELEEGSLGSLVTDASGNALGVKSRYTTGKNQAKDQISSVTAFRSKEIKNGKQTIIPKYDLIEGSGKPNDKSYKSSILNAKKNTYLSNKKGWSK